MKLPLSKLLMYILCANLLIWLFFWVSFAMLAEPYDPHPGGADFPRSPVTFWGYSVGLTQQVFDYPFGRLIFFVQLPSVLIMGLIRSVFFPQITQDWSFGGIDIGGYMFILLMLVSFLQWYFIGMFAEWIYDKIKRS